MRFWIPRQHGVWAMLIAPALCGSVVGGFRWWDVVIIVAWVSAYLGFMAVRGWVRDVHRAVHVVSGMKTGLPRRDPTPPYSDRQWRSSVGGVPPRRARPRNPPLVRDGQSVVILPEAGSQGRKVSRYRTPALVYFAVCVICVCAVVVAYPGALFWAVPLAAILGVSWILIASGHERSVGNDALLIASSCLIAVVAYTFGGVSGLSLGAFLHAVSVSRAWLIAIIWAGYLWGTIFYVKTMIRERGKTGWYLVSVIYHAALILPAFLVNPWIGAVSLITLFRAALIPRIFPRAKPKYIGFGEVALTVLLIFAICLTT